MDSRKEKVIIGTRGSELAMWQARLVADLLEARTELKIIKTSGDRFLDIKLQGRIEKGFFTKEIEECLISGEIDAAVHSLKDLPTQIDERLVVGAHFMRGPVSDLLVVRPDWHDGEGVLPLREGCVVGASSLRRQALLKLYGPFVEAALLRGNVNTRMRKCREGLYGAIVVAKAGVERLGLDLDSFIVYEFNPRVWLPAPGQGAIAVEARAGDQRILDLLSPIDHAGTRDAVYLERKLLANFEGGCHTAFGAYAEQVSGEWRVEVGIEREDSGWGQNSRSGTLEMCAAMGRESLDEFRPLAVDNREGLCRRIR